MRRDIAVLLRQLRELPQYYAALQRTRDDTDLFLRFVSQLVNDATFLVDEAISTMTTVQQIQREMQDAEAWYARPAPERRDREETLVRIASARE